MFVRAGGGGKGEQEGEGVGSGMGAVESGRSGEWWVRETGA